MSRSGFDETQDPRMPAPQQVPGWLMCAAHGCPNRWSVHREGWRPMCSAHAWQSPVLWPRITQEQLDWLEQHARWGATTPVALTPVPKAEPRPASTSRAWRDMHGDDEG